MFQRIILRLSIKSRTRKTRFREIKWTDDDEVRPVTRGKSKQFLGFEETAPLMTMTEDASHGIRSNLLHSPQAPLITKTALL